jgi:hypothetical protein
MENIHLFCCHLKCFTGLWYILWQFVKFCGHFLYYYPFLYVLLTKLWQPCATLGFIAGSRSKRFRFFGQFVYVCMLALCCMYVCTILFSPEVSFLPCPDELTWHKVEHYIDTAWRCLYNYNNYVGWSRIGCFSNYKKIDLLKKRARLLLLQVFTAMACYRDRRIGSRGQCYDH